MRCQKKLLVRALEKRHTFEGKGRLGSATLTEQICKRLLTKLCESFLQKTFLFLAKEALGFKSDNTQTEILKHMQI